MKEMEYSYYLAYKENRRGGKILFNVGTIDPSSTIITVGGRRARYLFDRIIEILNITGCSIPIQTGNPEVYSLKDDVGPVIGTYLMLIRGARNLDYWIDFLYELLVGKYSKLGGTFASLLELAIRLSDGAPPGKEYTLSPRVVLALSSALKVLIRSLSKGIK